MRQKHFIVLAIACILQSGSGLLPGTRAQVAAPSRTAFVPTLKRRPEEEVRATTSSPHVPVRKAVQVYRRAVHELHQGETAAAAKDAERAIHIDKDFTDAYDLSATADLIERDYPQAWTQATHAAQIDPADAKAWVIAATADNYLGRFAKAAEALSHVPQQSPRNWQVAYQWARAEVGQQNAQRALEWADQAALTAPFTFAPLHLLRASALLAKDQYGLSADELKTYLSLIAPDAPQHQELVEELHRLIALAMRDAEANSSASAPIAEFNALAN
ncbi:MAG TPA: hypothetical protein VFN53_11420 [Acidobacteriaceae bacterium]|nr:hypothetical protein [Acidobacteriaceae bacterium]